MITIIAYNSLHCPDTARFAIAPKLPPNINMKPLVIACSGSPVLLSVIVSGEAYNKFNWAPGGQTTDSITVQGNVTQTYTVTVSNGCKASDSVKVVADTPSINACCDKVIILGDDTVLSASGTGIVSYQWADTNNLVCLDPLCDSVRVTPTITTTYSVTGTDSLGCAVERTITIIVKETCIKLNIPNVFTPDYPGAFGLNNVFYIKTELMDSWLLEIYDRWGKEMYRSTNPTQYWDGTTESGSHAPAGVYYYIINATCQGSTYKKAGFVQVIR